MSENRVPAPRQVFNVQSRGPGAEQGPLNAAQEPGIELGAIAQFFRRRWKSIAAISMLVILAVAFWTYRTPKEYRSYATFLMEDKGQADAVPALGVLTSGGRLQNEIELLRSRRVVGEAVRELGLHVSTPGHNRSDLLGALIVEQDAEPSEWVFEHQGGGRYSIREADSGEAPRRTVTADSEVTLPGLSFRLAPVLPDEFRVKVRDVSATVAWVRQLVSASRVGRESDLFELSCASETAERAFRLCESVGHAYLDLRSELQRTEATQTREFLEGQVRLLGERLRLAEDSLEQYSERSGVVALPERSSREVTRAVDLRAERDLLIAEKEALASFRARITAGDEAGSFREMAYFPTFIDNEGVTNLISTLSELENRRAELALVRTEENADLASVNARIRDVENQLSRMVDSYEIALETQIASLNDALSSAAASLSTIPARQVELARRTRYASTLEETYRMLTMRLREAEIAEAVELPGVRVVDTASMPLAPSAPRPLVNLMLGSMLGLSLGITIAFLRDQTDRKIHGKKDVERETGLEVLTLIPHVSKTEPVLPTKHVSRNQIVLAQSGHNGGAHLPTPVRVASTAGRPSQVPEDSGASVSHPVDVEWTPALESFRSLATDIDFAVAGLSSIVNPVVAVTSAQQGEGKTYTASNLAIVAASFGRRTLLIDADLRSAGVSRFFGLRSDLPGLSDVLAGKLPAFDAWQTMSVQGAHALTVLPAGDARAAMLHHGTQGALHELIEFSRSLFELVIVDGPPLNLVSDSAVVAANVDAVLFVMRSGSSTPIAVKLSLERLTRATPHLLGVVLNDVGRYEHASPYAYYGYQGRRRRDT